MRKRIERKTQSDQEENVFEVKEKKPQLAPQMGQAGQGEFPFQDSSSESEYLDHIESLEEEDKTRQTPAKGSFASTPFAAQGRLQQKRLKVLKEFLAKSQRKYQDVPQHSRETLSKLIELGLPQIFPDLGHHLESASRYTEFEGHVSFFERLFDILSRIEQSIDHFLEMAQKDLENEQQGNQQTAPQKAVSQAPPAEGTRHQSLRSKAAQSGRVHVRL